MPTERIQKRIDALLDEADEAVGQQDWIAVRRLCDAVLRLDHENADARAYLEASEHDTGIDVGDPQPETPVESPEMASEASPETPTSFANGRYEVTGFLGEGGKKKVYLVHDTTLDRDVAFALIKAEGLDDASRQRITREAQAMARLGDNPNIMPIFDLGEENGQPYMVGPLMGGGDVEALIENAEDGRLSLEDALRIASEICHGLEFAHSKSIIHRDLKPGNVWLTEDGTARIGDFGLAISLDRSRLTQEKMMVGTVYYMPPEQATGGEITPKADLYSLGATLYEMVTGRPPFMGDDEIAIIGQHINTPPVAPQWHRPEIPATLDSLIMRLLSKNPAERPDSAGDVLSALEAIDVSQITEVASPSDADGTAEPGSLDSMAGGVFVGRHREMDQLKAALENALSGRGGMVTLVGEPGIGKTRTSLELETYAGLRNAQVVWGKCYEGGGAPPYWPWIQTIRSYISTHDPEQIRSQMGSGVSAIAEIVDDVKQQLPDIQPPMPLDDPDSARFRLFDSIATFLKNAGQVQPLVLVLDDLHWADKPSLMLLEFVVRELASSRVLLLGTYRDMELNRRHPLSVTLGDLTRERLFSRVLLRGLTRADVGRFIEVAAGIEPPSALIDTIHTQTEGNPLFVTETVRLLIQEGDITRGQAGERDTVSWEVRIPEGIREVIGRRLDHLSERCNEVLTIGSIIGREFRLNALKALVSDISEDRLLDVLDEALDARIIEELPSEIDLYWFTHALMQETLAMELSAARRVRLHARIAEALEQVYGNESDAHAGELAPHFAEAEPVLGTDRLVHYSAILGNAALSTYAYEPALQHLEVAMRILGDDIRTDQHADIAAALIRARIATIDPTLLREVIPAMRDVFDYYCEHDRPNDAIELALTDIRYGPFSLPDLEPILADAIKIAEPDSVDAGRLYARHGFVLSWEVGDLETGEAELGRAISIAQHRDDPRLELAIRLNFARSGELDQSVTRSYESLIAVRELAARMNDDYIAATAASTLTSTCLVMGHLAEANEYAVESLETARRIRYKVELSNATINAARVAYSMGQFSRSQELLDESLAYSQSGNRQHVLSGLMNLDRGDIEAAMFGLEYLLEKLPKQMESDPGWATHAASVAINALASGVELAGTEQIMAQCQQATASKRIQWVDQARLFLAVWAIHKGDPSTAESYYQENTARDFQFHAHSAHNQERILGYIAGGLGDHERAERHFELAIAQCGDDYRVEGAKSAADYAEMLLDRDDPGDREKATELQDEAIAITQEIGMRLLLERVLAQREILKA